MMQKLITQIRDDMAIGARHLHTNRRALERLKILSIEIMEYESHNEILRRRVKDLENELTLTNEINEVLEGRVAHG